MSKDYVDDIGGILTRFNGIRQVRVEKVGKTNLNIGFYTFTNEPKDIQYLYGSHQFGMSGDFLKEEALVFKEFIEAESQNDYIAKLGGIYTFASLFHDTFTAWNNVTRAEPIYWAENKERIVIGTKAILVHLIANESQVPTYKVSNMASFLNNGFYADENTPFEGINILEANRKIRVIDNTVKIEPIDDFEQTLYSIEPTSEIYDELSEAFLNSFTYLNRMNVDFSTGLTGGKDSRMVAGALHRLGIKFHARTTGFDSNPDVLIAQKLASTLGIQHEFNPPGAGKSILTADLYSRTVNTIKNTEGMLYSYENVGGTPKEFNATGLMLGGQGGAFLKGGYTRALQIKENESLEEFMVNTFMKYKEFFSEEAVNEYKDFGQKKFGISKYSNKSDGLNHFYLTHRGGRWTASSRPYYTARGYTFSPFFENQLVKKAQLIETKYGTSDEILYNILLRIAPNLIDIPFADDRWNFEKNHPYHKYELENWISRQPVQATSKLSAFNWRKNILKTSKKQFSDIIFANEDSPLFDIIDKENLKSLFTSPIKNGSRYDVFLWSLYTASILLSNEWFDEDTKLQSRISIKIPKQTEKKINGLIEDIKCISSKYLKSNHEKVIVDYKDTVTNHVYWKDYDGSNMYLQLFDGAFSNPPTEKFDNISKVKGRQADFHFEIEKVIPDNFEIELFFIQYDSEKRIKSTKKSFYINAEKEIYKYSVPLHQQTKSFKIAFKISKTIKKGSFMLNQMRLETVT